MIGFVLLWLPLLVGVSGVLLDSATFDQAENTVGTSSWRRPGIPWVKRQPIIHSRTLIANFFFTCPQGGRMTREFEWAAWYYPASRHLQLVGIHNIDSMDPPIVEGNDFYAHWHHQFCEHHGLQLCYYIVGARTEGTVFPSSVLISLITNSNIEGEAPTVSEVCIQANQLPPNETCWKTHLTASYGPCVINAIAVDAR